MRKLIEITPLKLSILTLCFLGFFIPFMFINGYCDYFKLPFPKAIEDLNYAEKWGQELRYKHSLVPIDIALEIKVTKTDGSSSKFSPNASIEVQSLRSEDELIIPVKYDSNQYKGKIKIHPDSSAIKIKVMHPGCDTKTIILPINWNNKIATKAKAEKIKCYSSIIKDLVQAK